MQPFSYFSLLFVSLGLICQISLGTGKGIVDNTNPYSPETGCWKGFIKKEGSCYQVFPKKIMWDEAEDDCRRYDGHLASIVNAGELKMLAKVLKKSKFRRVWIGLSDLDFDGNWEWTDESASAFKPWAEHPGVRTCTALFQEDGYMLFQPQYCSNKNHYICQHEPKFQPD